MSVHEGGCPCGAVRYRVSGEPLRASVCHCKYCQHRTGGPFGTGVYFRKDQVERLQGETRTYEHASVTSGRKLWNQFCARCGAAVLWTLEMIPDGIGVAGGSFDDPSWFRIERHVWTSSGHPWVRVPEGVEAFPESSSSPRR